VVVPTTGILSQHSEAHTDVEGAVVINENFARGRSRLPSEPDGPAYLPKEHPAWRSLQVGDVVKVYYTDRSVFEEQQPGVILGIVMEAATIRWMDRSVTPTPVSLRTLVKVKR
jgi:hypothetical protein